MPDTHKSKHLLEGRFIYFSTTQSVICRSLFCYHYIRYSDCLIPCTVPDLSTSQVLTDTDHCYCVILNAHEGGVFTSENTDGASGSTVSSPVSSPEAVTSAGKLKNPKVFLR